MLRQKGGHQRDPQEPVNQEKASHQKVSVSPCKETRRESKNSRTHGRGRVH